MATGDLSNNIGKLKTKLKLIKYTEEVNVNSLAEGSATAYLPVYQYAFTSYSPALAEQILGKDIELYGKFMESVYKVLRDFFSYKPPITKDQFFSRGFAERKVIMCTEILQLVKDKAAELNPGAAKSILKMFDTCQLICTLYTRCQNKTFQGSNLLLEKLGLNVSEYIRQHPTYKQICLRIAVWNPLLGHFSRRYS